MQKTVSVLYLPQRAHVRTLSATRVNAVKQAGWVCSSTSAGMLLKVRVFTATISTTNAVDATVQQQIPHEEKLQEKSNPYCAKSTFNTLTCGRQA